MSIRVYVTHNIWTKSPLLHSKPVTQEFMERLDLAYYNAVASKYPGAEVNTLLGVSTSYDGPIKVRVFENGEKIDDSEKFNDDAWELSKELGDIFKEVCNKLRPQE